MPHKSCYSFVLKILAVLILQDCVFCISIPSKSGKFHHSDKIRSQRSINASILSSSTDQPYQLSSIKKWQVGRVSRKHYEIVNMLWRKTKIFINSETTLAPENRFRRNHFKTTADRAEKIMPITQSTSKPAMLSSTASYIEFYYLNDNDERIKRRDSFLPALSKSNERPNSNIILQSPVVSFHVNDLIREPSPIVKFSGANPELIKDPATVKPPYENEKPSLYGFLSSRYKVNLIRPNLKLKSSNINQTKEHTSAQAKHVSTVYFDNETCPATLEPLNMSDTPDRKGTDYFKNKTLSNASHIETTTVYDKIKFFEMYDQYTLRSMDKIDADMLNNEDFENMIKENEIDWNKKVLLEDVNKILGHHGHDGNKAKFVKKHIKQNLKPTLEQKLISSKNEKKVELKSVVFKSNKTENKQNSSQEISPHAEIRTIENVTWRTPGNLSRVARWSVYPFAAVYIYEPSRIHCDAAALSPHWLVAAGSCLSRFHNKDPDIEGRSAFVAYCGQKWWQPERVRVSYVKYTIVHPQFHPKDNMRRVLFNIGLVQVVGSMSSACFGWAPISMMSHHFAAESDGSLATALGWGLDRYDVRYSAAELPMEPLSAFDGYVYSESCPGWNGFGKKQLSSAENTIKNLYCLSLPPYTGEQNDPVHGSLLLVGGKLIALYLQEERRAWGEQSAQYTGVWRLVPWVHQVAREQYESDGFSLDF